MAKTPETSGIPAFVVEYFLLGRTRPDAIQRFTEDGCVVSDVWIRFAREPQKSQRVLIEPSATTSAIEMGYEVHRSICEYRQTLPGEAAEELPNVSPLENFVAVTLYLDELLRIVMPLSCWWHSKKLSSLWRTDDDTEISLTAKLEREILYKLGQDGEPQIIRDRQKASAKTGSPDLLILEAAPVAALIGVISLCHEAPRKTAALHKMDPRQPDFVPKFRKWIATHAKIIAELGVSEMTGIFAPLLYYPDPETAGRVAPETRELIQRVFLDRKSGVATGDPEEGNRTIKADAAKRLFEVSCRDITWGIIDSGIASSHPAFADHQRRPKKAPDAEAPPPPSRVRATVDLTPIHLIKNFDLIAFKDETEGRRQAIEKVVTKLENLPGRLIKDSELFRKVAIERLTEIARQLDKRTSVDWNLIEPLIKLDGVDDGGSLISDHGTHVAGILAADWRDAEADGEKILTGVCPDISLYDLRVLNPEGVQNTEFAVLAALEYVQFVNARAGTNGPVIHGVNISMSIPHQVRTYGCGATPVCVACDRLSASGVVVVTAAGNRGWNEVEMGLGNFVFCSITDPGNAREAITVGSTHRAKPHLYGVSYFSSRGPTGDGRIKPDLVAPGEKIRGPVRGDADKELDGTSMAAPFVSGAAAMLLSRNRELIGNPARVKQILCDSATDLGREKYFQGHGLVDVLRAMQSL